VRARNLFVLATRRPGDDRHHAYRDCKRIARSESWTEVFDPLLGDLNRRAVEGMEYFGVHAGVIATADRTIAFPAASGDGKTTLVGACLRAGFGYVSDEALCVDYSTGAVISYPKPLNLSRWSMDVLEATVSDGLEEPDGSKAPVSPSAVGGAIVASPPGLTDVVTFERRPGPPSLERMPASQVVANLLKYSFNHYRRPADSYAIATNLARGCAGWVLGFDQPAQAAELMRSTYSYV
jgi:hypothetical protein